MAVQVSKKLSSHTAAGFSSRMTADAKPSEVSPSLRRPKVVPVSASPVISAARSTLGRKPASTAISRQQPAAAAARCRRLHSSSSPSRPVTAIRMERCSPETASRWLIPAAERLLRRPAGSAEVSEVSIPMTRALWESSPSDCSACTVCRRSRSRVPGSVASVFGSSAVSCCAVSATPPESSRVSPSDCAPVTRSVPLTVSPASGVSSSGR